VWWSFPFSVKHSRTWNVFFSISLDRLALPTIYRPIGRLVAETGTQLLNTYSFHYVLRNNALPSFYSVSTCNLNRSWYLKAAFSQLKLVLWLRQFRKQLSQ
jgi:hypothetical protein